MPLRDSTSHPSASCENDYSASTEWAGIVLHTPGRLRHAVKALVHVHGEDLARQFYDELMADPQSGKFLNLKIVEERLRTGLQHWLDELFSAEAPAAITRAFKNQRAAGIAHSRVRVPIGLVSRGARLLKHWIWDLILDSPDLAEMERRSAITYVSDLVDIALEVMNSSFLDGIDREGRTEEVYRLISLSQDLALERERQRAALLEWNQQAFYALCITPTAKLPRIAESEFGMWMQHKAGFLFEKAPEVTAIMDVMARIDTTLAAAEATRSADDAGNLVTTLQNDTAQIKFLMTTLLDRYLAVENGRDTLTNLLSRRFLATIMMREIQLAQRTKSGFAVALVDLDHFKAVNDRHGHSAGDAVLHHVATTIVNSVRAGDVIFRMGGEEILVLFAGASAENAMLRADMLRTEISEAPVTLPGTTGALRITASIGVAAFDGHPDYQRLIDRADTALYAAKAQGRNRCVLAHADR